MTDIIPMLYPATGIKSSGLDVLAELSKCVEMNNRLNVWKTSYLQQIDCVWLDVHPTVPTHAHITSLYYQYVQSSLCMSSTYSSRSVRIALCHHIALLLYVHKTDWHDNQVFGLNDLKQELTDAFNTVTDKVKQFILNGTARHLPLAVLLNVLLPNFLLRLNSQLSCLSAEDQLLDGQGLQCYSVMTKLCAQRYDTSYVAQCNDQLMRMFEIAEMNILAESSKGISVEQRTVLPKSYTDILEYQPAVYLRLATTLDILLATGINPENTRAWSALNGHRQFKRSSFTAHAFHTLDKMLGSTVADMQTEFNFDNINNECNLDKSIFMAYPFPSTITGWMFDDVGFPESFSNILEDLQQDPDLSQDPKLDFDRLLTQLPLFGE